MKSTRRFLDFLDALDVAVWEEGGELQVDGPSEVLTTNLIEKLKNRKQELLSFFHHKKNSEAIPPIVPRNSEYINLLSFAQERLWFLDQFFSDNPFYNMPAALSLTGPLDTEALRKSFNEIIRRHEALRTGFKSKHGYPVQRIMPDADIEMPINDLSSLPEDRKDVEIRRAIREEAEQVFDLSRPPLVRFCLLKIDDGRHILLMTMHHIVSDGWSMGVMNREISALYNAFAQGKSSPLPELTVQYTDFADWQRNRLTGEVLKKQLDYWKRHLEGFSPLNFQTDHPRPPVVSYRGGVVPVRIPADLTRSLKKISRELGATLFMTLLAGFKALLYRYTGQEDIAVGAPIAGRNHRETESLIGFFVNTLVMRNDLSGNPSFLETVIRVRKTALDAYENQEVPFEQIVAELQPERDMSRNPLVQVAFALQNAPMDPPELEGLKTGYADLESLMVRMDMEFHLWETGDELNGSLVFCTDLFELPSMEKLIGHFIRLLQDAVEDPEKRIADLTLLGTEERHQLLVEWNDTKTDYSQNKCIHHLFEAQAERSPDAVAFLFEDEQVTYGTLNRCANQLAHHLRSLGVGPEAAVGICMERSAEMVVGILGILKAGGAYLPIDPDTPRKRSAFMLEDAGVRVMVTQKSLAFGLPECSAVVCMEDLEQAPEYEKNNTHVIPENLAYVIYTSGSTGKPKGVSLDHKGLVNLVCWHLKQFDITEADHATLLANSGFDASVWELWPYLAAGARISPVPSDIVISPTDLKKWLISNRITVTFLPTPLAEQLLRSKWPDETDLRTILTGGDRLVYDLDIKLPFEVINNYGPTENTVVTTSGRIEFGRLNSRLPDIGTPIGNTQVYILDSHLKPVPVGITGELHIGGMGLTRGYLNRPGLTAENFIPNPFGETGERLYRTGDLARWLPGGNVEFLGRRDHQVKIRGFRIELGEIEAILSEHPDVQETAVIAREANPGDKRLAAYVVPSEKTVNVIDYQREQIAQWQNLYAETYSDESGNREIDFNITGWNSSFTGRAIPDEEMREWVENTVDRIFSLTPDRVLEIGCGTGLLLSRIAPACSEYWATDFSPAALAHVQKVLRHKKISDRVHLLQRTADNFDGMEKERFDVVILNSVVQYFPDAVYLFKVIEGAVKVVRPGGFIFLGDLRNHALLKTFHTAVQVHQASDSVTVGELKELIAAKIRYENELLISPSLFHALERDFPEITQVRTLVKQGRYQNELAMFRYDAILHVKGDPSTADVRWLDWNKDHLGIDDIRRRMEDCGSEIEGIRHVPNARIEKLFRIEKRLDKMEDTASAGALREDIDQPGRGVDPEFLWEMGRALSCHVAVLCTDSRQPDTFDVVFVSASEDPKVLNQIPSAETPFKPWRVYANNPLHGKSSAGLISDLKEMLLKRVPDYMVPSAFMIVDDLPQTPSGKIDLKALPDPDRSLDTGDYAPPRTPNEEIMASIWAETLALEKVGIRDNFFDLGGHSLLATQIISRIGALFDKEIAVRDLFEHPTVEELACIIGENVAEKEDGIPFIPRDAETHPMSFAQERLWFLTQLLPDNPLYNMPTALNLVGPLDINVLRRSFNIVIRRHETLRTGFGSEHGIPVQRFMPNADIRIPIQDFSSLTEDRKDAEIRTAIRDEAKRVFDLSRPPLFRASLLKTDHERHILLITMHHIVSDGWSMGILNREISTLYNAFVKGDPSPLPKLPIQYADFAAWQRHQLTGDFLETRLNYWKRKLKAISPLKIHTDRPRPSVVSYRGGIVPVKIPADLTASLKKLSRKSGATLFMTLLAGFSTLLSRYTGQEDIAVGSPIANRTHRETESLIGFFVNTLVMRTDLSGNPTFLETVSRVRKTALDAYDNQDLPFEQIVAELQPERDMSRNPLVQVVFALQNAPMDPLELEGLKTGYADFESVMVRMDMECHIWEIGDELAGSLLFCTDLFELPSMERLIGHFIHLLRDAAENPDRRIADLTLLGTEEKHKQLVEWNDTKTDYFRDKCIHHLFEAQAERSPDAVAVLFEDEQITYGALNRRANQLAHHLRPLGVGPEAAVGICMERSAEMVVGILGILKAGGAYLPIDSDSPRKRVAFMLEDAGACVIVTQRSLASGLPESYAVVCLEDLEQSPESEKNDTHVIPENLAYIIYTSGSTGKPKGVSLNHMGLVNLVCWHLEQYNITEADHATLLANPGFDASVWELWPYLAAGAMISPVPSDIVISPDKLKKWLISNRITVTFLPTPLTEQLLRSKWPDETDLRMVLTGGDRLVYDLDLGLPFEVINNYGPTENTVVTTSGRIDFGTLNGRLPDIGKPVDNTRIYILDSRLKPVPVGISGELHISGIGLARGYLGRPGLTAEKFIPNPFGKPGERLYKTGDLARWLPEGNIEFLGRIDDQVKIRGFRIEPGEIEAGLASHPSVRENAVVACETENGDKYLAAYVVKKTDRHEKPFDFRNYLKKSLPDYMIPTVFKFMDAIPLTHSGKIDRKALPDPDRSLNSREYAPPRTPTEEITASVWAEALNLEKVGIYDNFFDLGGHSLLATRIISRIAKLFEKEIAVRDLFEHPTVEEFVCIIGENRAVNEEGIPVIPRDAETFPLSFAQERLWFIDQLIADKLLYHMPTAFDLVGSLCIDALKKSLNEVIRRHETLRTGYVSENGVPAQQILPDVDIRMPIQDFSSLPEDRKNNEIRQAIQDEAERAFDLSRPPLFRVGLIKICHDRHILMITMHHIVSDGWSMGIMHREISALYNTYANKEPSPLQELPVQYVDFAAWQRKRLAGNFLEAQLDYWKRKVKDLSPLNLYTDHPRPPVASSKGGCVPVRIPADLTGSLKRLSRESGATLFMTLLAGFSALLSRYTGQEDIAVGSPIANRNHRETEPLIGFFVNTLVMRTDLSGDPTFLETVSRVRKTALDAYVNQDVPFEQIVSEFKPERDMSRNPLVQVMFAFQNAPMEALRFGGLDVSSAQIENVTVTMDMELHMWEQDDEIVGTLLFSSDLFEKATMERLTGHFLRLLQSAVKNPDIRITDLEIIGFEEKHQLLVEWNDTKRIYPRDKCIHQLFEKQAEKAPEAVAVIMEERRLTYGELNERANCLGHYLRKLGIGPEMLVGICMERSIEMIVGLLGILKAGSAYVPIDPEYPGERMAFMLEDTRSPILLTQAHLLDILPGSSGKYFCLDRDWKDVADESKENLDNDVGPDNLVYAIYTSGTTGDPKGTLVEHGSLVNLAMAQKEFFKIDTNDRILQFSSLCFDASAEQIWLALTTGASLVLVTRETLIDPNRIDLYMRRHKVTHLDAVPSFLSSLKLQQPCTIKRVLASAEACPPEIARKLSRDFQFYNVYGLTETAVTSIEYAVDRNAFPADRFPIGRPIANTQAYILDKRMKPVPIGVPGELYIAGAGIARGYLNRPDLTESKFPANPLVGTPGDRLCRTGDLCRYGSDGNIEFLGRIDHQVKIRGFRIEPGEIASLLHRHERVDEAVVVAREDLSGNMQLAAYLTLKEGETAPEPSELQTFLKAKLPAYMIPSAYATLEKMPLTSSGKIDRRALPDPEVQGFQTTYTAPRDVTEKTIARIWEEVLGLEQVGIHENFFDIGGNSLLLMRVVSGIKESLGTEVPVIRMFEHPNIDSLSRYLSDTDTRGNKTGGDSAETGRHRRESANRVHQTREIAIVGMAGRFPGAFDIDAFWDNLRDGVESISFFSDQELLNAAVEPAMIANPDYVRAGGILADIDKFDAAFFDYSPMEASVTDPQIRLFLECAWEALETAGYNPRNCSVPVGVYTGKSFNGYFIDNLYRNPDILKTVGGYQLSISNGTDFLSTHTSYKLNLTGPSIGVQTACSTSLVAVHMACQSLVAGECGMALAGGVSVSPSQKRGYLY